MNSRFFNLLLNSVSSFSDVQFILLKNKINNLNHTDFISVNLDKISEVDYCRYCKSDVFIKWGRRDGMQRYKCKCCGKTFNCLSGTPLAKLGRREQWIKYANCLIKGLSIRKAATECNIHKNTSFKWRHRFLFNTIDIKADNMNGIVELDSIDEIKSYKGSRNMPRDPRKRGLSMEEKIISKEKFTVFFGRNRASHIYDKIFDNLCLGKIDFSIDNILKYDSLLFSEKNSIYGHFTKVKPIQHSTIKERKNKVKNNIVHIDNVKQYHSDLCKWMKRFNGVATKYFDNYLSWYRFLDEFKMQIKPETIVIRAIRGGIYKKLPLFGT